MKYDEKIYNQARREMVQDLLKHASAVELGETVAKHIATRLPRGFGPDIMLAAMDDGELFEYALEMKGFINLLLFKCRLLIGDEEVEKYITNETRQDYET